jgi:signal transduction protein with GAF and PtsI domain
MFIQHNNTDVRVEWGVGFIGAVAMTHEILNAADPAVGHEKFDIHSDHMSGCQARTILTAPILHSGRMLGAIQVYNKLPSEGRAAADKLPSFDVVDELMLSALVMRVAVNLHHAAYLAEISAISRHTHMILNMARFFPFSQKDYFVLWRTFLARTQAMINCERFSIWLVDQKTNMLWTQLVSKASGLEEIREVRVPMSAGVVGRCAAAGTLLNIRDCYSKEGLANGFNPEVDRRTGYKTKNLLCVPMLSTRGTTIGVAQLLNKKKGYFVRMDEMLVQAHCTQAALMLDGEVHLDHIPDNASQLHDLMPYIGTTLEQVKSLVHAERVYLFLLDDQNSEQIVLRYPQRTVAAKSKESHPTQFGWKLGQGIVGHTWKTHDGVAVQCASNSSMYDPSLDLLEDQQTNEEMTTPIRVGFAKQQYLIGVLSVVNKHMPPTVEPGEESFEKSGVPRFDSRDEIVLTSIAMYLGKMLLRLIGPILKKHYNKDLNTLLAEKEASESFTPAMRKAVNQVKRANTVARALNQTGKAEGHLTLKHQSNATQSKAPEAITLNADEPELAHPEKGTALPKTNESIESALPKTNESIESGGGEKEL